MYDNTYICPQRGHLILQSMCAGQHLLASRNAWSFEIGVFTSNQWVEFDVPNLVLNTGCDHDREFEGAAIRKRYERQLDTTPRSDDVQVSDYVM